MPHHLDEQSVVALIQLDGPGKERRKTEEQGRLGVGHAARMIHGRAVGTGYLEQK